MTSAYLVRRAYYDNTLGWDSRGEEVFILIYFLHATTTETDLCLPVNMLQALLQPSVIAGILFSILKMVSAMPAVMSVFPFPVELSLYC